MKLLITLALGSVFLIATVGGCDTQENGKATANSIASSITKVCGVTENSPVAKEATGPRTVTPIDLDGSSGPSGFLVTCINGRTAYVKATK